MGMEVLDKIQVAVERDSDFVNAALSEFSNYIQTETQAVALTLMSTVAEAVPVELDDITLKVKINVKK
jgi:isoleucyl-tRNA synthetase